ncbi:hypothetical protein ARALYDRAFT_908937 [Arabidopsis lyrata subsp. lyrata]|uniref:Uncharacterized protein n=1 Tax=Arabidopsis lyrata subsp. lyrata TaxID=81972 RepID=D7M283_ARALL|nr:uncharacterized protein LOC9307460 [Arabidopsis lyrata subsp. lyrata]EFH47649.1 hypothetical protein ARALYDRAFT_908937 [Arabidopsis lyrata subsp. lyrata]|eukprot:XP_020876648.1 uncharacterized protein LOC9307460 [Arabidopsis lyrata subsp. lyrata]
MEKIQSKKETNKRRRRDEMITEIEMEAAQQLMQLSDEENNINIIKKKKTIEEIFGKDDIHDQDHQCTKEMVVLRVMSSKTKKKKYRTIESIYMATRPIRVVIR